MLRTGLQLHQIDHVHYPNLELRQMHPQDGNGRQDLEGRGITATGHSHVWLAALIIAGPLPNADALGAMDDRRVHGEPLGKRVFAGDYYVDVIAASQTM